MQRLFSRVVPLTLALTAVPALAGPPVPGSITFSAVATSVPTLGTVALVLLGMLLAFIAVLSLKNNGKSAVTSITFALAITAFSSAGGIQWVERVSAGTGGVFSITSQGGQTFSVLSGSNTYTNNAGVPMRATSVTLPSVCPGPSGTPLCTVGLELDEGEMCEIICGVVVSDRRLKADIVLVGVAASGLPLYEYRYQGSAAVYRGVMAQEVLFHTPSAVHLRSDGYLSVDYDQLSLPFTRVR